MKYITFGEDKLSKLSLGTVQFGLDYGIANEDGKPTQDIVNDIVDYLYEGGVNCFDTAQAYGSSEVVLKDALQGKDKIFVISKLKSDTFKNDIRSSVTNSLDNLGIKNLYGLLLHDSQLLYRWGEEDTKSVQNLIVDGKIKHFGVSIYTSKDFDMAIENDSIEFIQIPFNLFDHRAIRENWFKRAKDNKKLIFIRSIFLQGLLLMDIDKVPKKLDKAKPYIKVMNILSQELNISKSELALSFVDTITEDSLILFGCENMQQAQENLKNYEKLRLLDSSVIKNIMLKFSDIDESIYNPSKW